MVQHGERRLVLGARASARLFALLASEEPARLRLAAQFARTLPSGLAGQELAGQTYLNVGHTGLDAPGLTGWLDRHRLRPIFFVHDLIPIFHPHFCREGESGRHRLRMDQVLRCAQGIVVNSRHTETELRRYARMSGHSLPRTLVAPLGVEPALTKESASEEQALSGDAPPWFVCVGTIEARKNHKVLLDAWDIVRETMGPAAPDLVLVGRRGWEAQEVWTRLDQPQPRYGRVIECGQHDDGALRRLLAGATALLMPSRAEGYGLPVVEALASGTAVIASDLAVYRESAGDAPIYLDPDDVAGWAGAVMALMRSPPPRPFLAGFRALSWDSHFDALGSWLGALPQSSCQFPPSSERGERPCRSRAS